MEREEDFEVEPLGVLELEEDLAPSELKESSWGNDWGLEAGAPAVEGMTCAVGIGIWLRIGWKGGLLLVLRKSPKVKQQRFKLHDYTNAEYLEECCRPLSLFPANDIEWMQQDLSGCPTLMMRCHR